MMKPVEVGEWGSRDVRVRMSESGGRSKSGVKPGTRLQAACPPKPTDDKGCQLVNNCAGRSRGRRGTASCVCRGACPVHRSLSPHVHAIGPHAIPAFSACALPHACLMRSPYHPAPSAHTCALLSRQHPRLPLCHATLPQRPECHISMQPTHILRPCHQWLAAGQCCSRSDPAAGSRLWRTCQRTPPAAAVNTGAAAHML